MLKANTGENTLLKEDLIEVEYLILSEATHNVLYFSTIPDRRQKYYADHYLEKTWWNCWDLRILYTGKFAESSNEEILYVGKDNNSTDSWEMEFAENKSKLYLNAISERKEDEFIDYMPVKEALSDRITFVKSDNFKIVWVNPNEEKKDTAILVDNRIYFKKKKNKYEVYFHFDRKLMDNFTDIYFKNNRIMYSPEPLYIKK